MTTAQVVETSVAVNNNSPTQDYFHPDDQTQPTFDSFHFQILMSARMVRPSVILKVPPAITLFHYTSAIARKDTRSYQTTSINANVRHNYFFKYSVGPEPELVRICLVLLIGIY